MPVRRSLPLLIAVALLTTVALAPARAARPAASVRVGRDAFWAGASGPVVERGDGLWRTFRVDVGGGGARLRLAVDHPDWRVYLDWAVVTPSGKRTWLPVSYQSSEYLVEHPQAGTWTVEVRVPGDSYTDFRMRARLERHVPTPPRKPVALLPNLRLVPPYEFTFASVVTVARESIGLTSPSSCTADDTAQYQGVRCLRFSVGPANVGVGPLELDFPGGQGVALPGNATQRVLWSDGHWTERPAGTFQYHATHMHYHHTGFGSIELLQVTDPSKGTMTHAGNGPKQGFCTGDVLIADWQSFANAPQFSAPSRCLSDMGPGAVYDPNSGTQMGLSAGWADIYSWEQDGNFVAFPLATDGRFVVRSTADAAGNILESDETDNTGYAYLEVTGTTVQVLERGRGQSPWDPRKVVVHDGLHPNA